MKQLSNKSFNFAILSLLLGASGNALAAGGPGPADAGIAYKASFENVDGSITFIEPGFLYQGRIVFIQAYSSAKGVCRILGYKKPKIMLPQTGRTLIERTPFEDIYLNERMVLIGSKGEFQGAVKDTNFMGSITCR